MGGGLLLKLFIFNNTISTKEEKQAENILYYYPPGVKLDDQLMDIGLSGAFVGFHNNFDPDSDISCLVTDSYQFVWFSAEPEYWIGIATKRQSESQGSSVEDYEESSLKAYLRQGYHLFRLHYGTMSRFRENGQMDGLLSTLKSFWDIYTASMLEPVSLGTDLFDTMDGIKYLPVDRSAYLKVQALINQLETSFPVITTSMVLIDSLLLYTGLNVEDTHTLYKYLSRTTKIQSGKGVDYTLALNHPKKGQEGFTGFLTPTLGIDIGKTGLRQFRDKVLGRKADAEQLPITLWVGPLRESSSYGNQLSQTSLVVYQCGRIMFSFLCDPEAMKKQQGETTTNFYRGLKDKISEALPKISTITDSITKSLLWDEAYQYIYFNRMNLALKSSLRRRGAAEQETLRHVERLRKEFVEMPNIKEAWARTKENTWVVGRKSGSREFYSVFEGKSHLSEAHEEVKRVSQVFFNGIFVD
eukprot:TRINITY_DN22864_c0_g1_i1.p1 TRINITY_DN22864_c0_g1~~TRINITY_DN22864_c0_g1_i1.p1  ORF type:complete len:470 (+),score=77.95 TRINITY_DN22864_c0_g1_i1:56-1465(+)